ncbi:TRAP transporter substrate-binding protein [Clostridiaceae bacterium 35-E11]
MKKRMSLLMAVLLITTMILGGCGNSSQSSVSDGTSSDAATYEMRIAHCTSEQDPIHLGFSKFKELIEERTEGKIKVTIYPNKAISNSDSEQAEMIKNGSIEMSSVPTYVLVGMNDTLKSFYIYDYPYLFESDEEIYKFGDSEMGKEMMNELLEKTGIRGYGPYNLGWIKVSTSKTPIDKPSDIKGLKIRTTVSELYMETMKAWGGNATPMAYGEVFTGLQQGTIDGMMTSTGLYVSDKFYEVQKFMGAINPFGIVHIPIVSDAWYQNLPDDLKKVFDETMVDYLAYTREEEAKYENQAIKTLREKGMTVKEYSEEELEVFKQLAQPVAEKKADLAGAEYIGSVKEFLGK